MSKGLIHVYTGDGKGKTTAAYGLAIRAAGHGRRVLILQFLKSRIRNTGEVRSARKCGIKVVNFKGQTTPLFDATVKLSDLRKSIKESIDLTIEMIRSGRYDLVIMEEFNNVVGNGYATNADVQKILDEKHEDLELVFTGRNATKELLTAADYVTEMKMIKHPANNGLNARKGIEF